jgi:adenosine deaminase CECR1
LPSDFSFRQSLSPIAKRACEIVGRIRGEEQTHIWTPGLEEQIAQQQDVTIYPGMMFALAKDIMEKTKLWRIVRRMPKGALLHAHCDGRLSRSRGFMLAGESLTQS